jgi:hypothetical protein
MPEEKIQLPSFLIADLYKESLVIIDSEIPQKAPNKPVIVEEIHEKQPKSKPKWFLGENKKNIVICVKDDSSEFLEEESLQLLTTMLTACKLGLNDVAIVNLHTASKNYNELHALLEGKQYLLFGITTSDIDLPFAFPYYQLQNFNNCTFVSAPPLELLKANTVAAKTEKSKLWLCLKQMFNV